ncbi:MAG: hypothetical protein RL095_2704 [Verrucomicrobiota bacterium]|jgi:hypothetical protein
MKPLLAAGLLLALAACSNEAPKPQAAVLPQAAKGWKANKATAAQEKEIRALIEQLVLSPEKADGKLIYSPGVDDPSAAYRDRYERCQQAFLKLQAFKELAFPYLIEHRMDQRQSIPFMNHYEGSSVGDACHWAIAHQMWDAPRHYSRYGLMRKGKDGKMHHKPRWTGSPFDEAASLKLESNPFDWLEKHKNLSYVELKLKCVEWILAREKEIGADTPDSYFQDILPLEIRVLELQQECGKPVGSELARLRDVEKHRRVEAIPPEMLPPAGTSQAQSR